MARMASITTMRKFAGETAALLGLSHWEIYMRLFSAQEQATDEYSDANAFVRWQNQHTIAEIAISPACEDWRHAIIHELLHLRIDGHAPFENAPSGAEEHSREVAINALTKAILSR